MRLSLGITPKSYFSLAASNDADAQAFIDAAGITDATQKSAVNQLVLDLKSANIWTKMKAIYPIVGGTASTHKWNLKDPRDLDAAYRLTFATGWTHSSTGMTPVNAYANTFFNPSAITNNNHISLYIRTNIDEAKIDMGVYNAGPGRAFDIEARISNTAYYGNHVPGIFSTYSITDSRGFHINTRTTSTNQKGYLNGVLKVTNTSSGTQSISANTYIGARNDAGTANYYATKQYAFASIGDGLTDTEAANFYTAVQNYQTTLGRNV